MKGLIKRIARSLWGLTGPVRRPVSRKVSQLIEGAAGHAVRDATHPQLGELLVGVATARREVGTYRNETNLLLDSLVREMTRLQDEVAALQAQGDGPELPTVLTHPAVEAHSRRDCG